MAVTLLYFLPKNVNNLCRNSFLIVITQIIAFLLHFLSSSHSAKKTIHLNILPHNPKQMKFNPFPHKTLERFRSSFMPGVHARRPNPLTAIRRQTGPARRLGEASTSFSKHILLPFCWYQGSLVSSPGVTGAFPGSATAAVWELCVCPRCRLLFIFIVHFVLRMYLELRRSHAKIYSGSKILVLY